MTRVSRWGAALGVAGLVLAAAGCAKGTTPSASGAGGEIDQNAPVTITIGDRPTPDKPNDLKAFNQKIADFTAKNPNITVKSTETSWQAQTFQAQVAGGTLPTVMNISFTEPANMIPQAARRTSPTS